ncbi:MULTISPECIES: hypothetical protein [Metabacillus]|uniref:hypothetical protein n=1 Tax=Metabacillus TaxID=2675233 RepID=UPI000C7FFD54|nr:MULTISPECIES: hypothetical protein [Metabacillus]MCM3443558.1 hypothetical protein [Metabacillus halosaccharovorans]PMC35024.1 hypothetical protein CJ195_21200 [Bacillus sp. UMB0899]
MFKLTCFAPVHPSKLGPALQSVHFKEVKGDFIWEMDGTQFVIEPFKKYGDHQSSYGYRVYFNGSIDGALYLFDMSMGCFQPQINAVEYTLHHQSKNQESWIKDLFRRSSFEKSKTRGIFQKGNVGVICLPDSTVNLQIRKKVKSFRLIELIKEIECLRQEIMPSDYDLFSVEGVAI